MLRNALVYTDKEENLHVSGVIDDCFATDTVISTALTVSHAEAEEFYQKGYFCLEHGVEMSIINDARKYIDFQYSRWLAISKRQDDWRCHLQLDISSLNNETPVKIEHVPILNLLVKSPVIMGKLRSMMGAEPSGIFYSQVAYRTPVKPNVKPVKTPRPDYIPGAEYHLDGSANLSGTRFPDPWTVMVGVALVDILTLDMGNFTVFPGSHTCRDWSSYPEEKIAKTLPNLGDTVHIALPAGGAVFAHVLLAHRGGKNVKNSDTSAVPECEENRDEDGDIESFAVPLESGAEARFTARHIPANTREMVFIRVQAQGIDYADPQRSINVLSDPWHEFSHMLHTHLPDHCH